MAESDETITVKGEVVSVKPKYDQYDPEALGITVKPRGGGNAFWFRWSPSRGKIVRGDIVEITARKTGESTDGKMVFLAAAKIEGKVCSHVVLTRNGKGYICAGCEASATVMMRKGA